MNNTSAVVAITVAFLLTSCSSYSNKFACGSSSGAKCVMISEVDKMIDSGEIEEFHKKRKCNGNKRCLKEASSPKLNEDKTHKVLVAPPKTLIPSN
jgi:hypothetical protein